MSTSPAKFVSLSTQISDTSTAISAPAAAIYPSDSLSSRFQRPIPPAGQNSSSMISMPAHATRMYSGASSFQSKFASGIRT